MNWHDQLLQKDPSTTGQEAMTYKPAVHKTLDGRTEDGRIPWEVSCMLDTDPLRKPSWRLCFWWWMMMTTI